MYLEQFIAKYMSGESATAKAMRTAIYEVVTAYLKEAELKPTNANTLATFLHDVDLKEGHCLESDTNVSYLPMANALISGKYRILLR